MASPCGSPASSLYQPPRRSRHPPSYSSSAATWTNCDQPQQHATRCALEPPYSGPHKVIARTDKTLANVVRGRQVNVSVDRVKPAYVLEGTQHDTSSPPAQPRSDPVKPVTTQPPQTTRSVRMHCTLPSSVHHLSSLLHRGGGDVGIPTL